MEFTKTDVTRHHKNEPLICEYQKFMKIIYLTHKAWEFCYRVTTTPRLPSLKDNSANIVCRLFELKDFADTEYRTMESDFANLTDEKTTNRVSRQMRVCEMLSTAIIEFLEKGFFMNA